MHHEMNSITILQLSWVSKWQTTLHNAYTINRARQLPFLYTQQQIYNTCMYCMMWIEFCTIKISITHCTNTYTTDMCNYTVSIPNYCKCIQICIHRQTDITHHVPGVSVRCQIVQEHCRVCSVVLKILQTRVRTKACCHLTMNTNTRYLPNSSVYIQHTSH